MTDNPILKRSTTALAVAVFLLLGLFARIDVSTGTVVGHSLITLPANPATSALGASSAPSFAVVHASAALRDRVRERAISVRQAKLKAARAMRARCARAAGSVAKARANGCYRLSWTVTIRRFSIRNTRHEVVCHRGIGAGATHWVAIPPDKASSHIGPHGHPYDFILFADYPSGANWADLKDAISLKCDEAAPKPQIEPKPPTKHDVCGTKDDTYTIPVTEGIVYSIGGAPVAAGTYPGTGTVTIQAAAVETGVVLKGPATWTFTFTDEPCVPNPTYAPAAPEREPVCGPNNDHIIIPESTKFTYQVSQWLNNTATVTATPKSGVTVTPGAQTEWTFTDAAVPCDGGHTGEIPPAPQVDPKCGPNNDRIIVPESTKFSYAVSEWVTNRLTVVATPKPGVEIKPGADSSWTFIDEAVPCDDGPTALVPPAPTVKSKCGANNDVVTLPVSEAFTYSSTGWRDNTVTITATPNRGYVVKDGAQSEWTFVDEAHKCDSTGLGPRIPTLTPKCGPNNDIVVIPDSNAFSYSVSDWVNNTATVVATPRPDVVVKDGATLSWTFVDAATPCAPEPIVAAAPIVTAKCGPNNDTVRAPAGAPLGVSYQIGVWSNNQLTVTAIAGEGVTLVGTTRWTVRDAAVACPTRLSVAKRGPAVASAKKSVLYTITVRNVGRAPAYRVVLRDIVPAGMVLVAVPPGARMSAGRPTWFVGTLAAGAARTVTLRLRLAGNASVLKCNVASAGGSNAPTTSGRACTRFVRVAGVRTGGGVTG